MATLSHGYSILPNTVLYDQQISSSAKLLYACISSHCAKTGKCFATNDYLAEKMGVSIRNIQKQLGELLDTKYVEAEFNDQKNKRLLGLGGVSKTTGGGVENDTHNNTNIIVLDKSNTNVTLPEVKEVFDFYTKQFNSPRTLFTDGRKRQLNHVLKVCGREMVMEAIKRTSQSKWHRGDNARGWKADLDFIIRKPEQIERLSKLEPPQQRKAIRGV